MNFLNCQRENVKILREGGRISELRLFFLKYLHRLALPKSEVPYVGISYVQCFLLLRSYLCGFLSLCYSINGIAPQRAPQRQAPHQTCPDRWMPLSTNHFSFSRLIIVGKNLNFKITRAPSLKKMVVLKSRTSKKCCWGAAQMRKLQSRLPQTVSRLKQLARGCFILKEAVSKWYNR